MKLLFCILIIAIAANANENNAEQYLKEGVEQFTVRLGSEVARQHPGESVVLSGYSVMPLLAMLGLASTGTTHDEVLKTIGLPNDTVVKEAFSGSTNRLKSVKGVTLKMANKIYVNKKFELNDEFAAVSKGVFDSEVQSVDFSQAEKSAAEINSWVESHTNNLIKNLVEKDSIDSQTASILVNAIYFKGNWKEKFDPRRTMDRDFYVSKGNKVQVPMMYKNGNFLYGESKELDAKLLEIPYEGEEASFMVILPNDIEGLPELQRKLSVKSLLSKAESEMNSVEVDVFLPKFKIETQTDLKEALENMNLKSLFSPYAEITKLIKGNQPLSVSKGIQKAFIEVNEEGSEAAAASGFFIDVRCGDCYNPPPPVLFTANKAFYFLLKHQCGILFNGVFSP